MESTNSIHHGESLNWKRLKNGNYDDLSNSIIDIFMTSCVSMSIDKFPGRQNSNGVCCKVEDGSDQPWSTSFTLNGYHKNQEQLTSDVQITNIKCSNKSESRTQKDANALPSSVTNWSLSPPPSIFSENEIEQTEYDKDRHFATAMNYINFLDEYDIVNEKSNKQCYYPSSPIQHTNSPNEDCEDSNNSSVFNHSYLPSKCVQLTRRSISSLNSFLSQSQRNLRLKEEEYSESDDTQQTINTKIKIYETKSEKASPISVTPKHQIKSETVVFPCITCNESDATMNMKNKIYQTESGEGLPTFVAPTHQIKSETNDYSYAACHDTNEMSISFSNIQKMLQSEKEDYSLCLNGSISDFSSDDDEMDDRSSDIKEIMTNLRGMSSRSLISFEFE